MQRMRAQEQPLDRSGADEREADTANRAEPLQRFRGSDWSEWQDLNLRPRRPERRALPGCATLRDQSAGL